MGRFMEGEDRRQQTMLPACLEDYIADDNPLRVVDAFLGQQKTSDRARLDPAVIRTHLIRDLLVLW